MGRFAAVALVVCLALGCGATSGGDDPADGGQRAQIDRSEDLPALALMGPWAVALRGRAARQSTWDPSGSGTDRFIEITGGQTVTIFEAHGPGVIRHIWLTTVSPPPMGRVTVLRMYWDGSGTPAVEVPLGDFFAAGHGMQAEVNSFPVTVGSQGGARNCWWPMPFAEGARITVTNEAASPVADFHSQIDWLALDAPPPTRERFCAQYRQAYPAASPENYVILEAEGQGEYVGTVLSVETTSPEWWGEGDDLFEIDGQEALHGTGTEDYFCGAWGIHLGGWLWHGASISEGFTAAGLHNTLYRWHILDSIPFRENLRVSIEHGTGNDRADNVSSVAFWYQVPPAAPFPPLPPVGERLSRP
jgi:hypothetical protein